jgi:hypothetical protein
MIAMSVTRNCEEFLWTSLIKTYSWTSRTFKKLPTNHNKREGWIHSKLLSRASRKQLALKSLSSKLNPMIFKDRTSYVQIAVTLDELS